MTASLGGTVRRALALAAICAGALATSACGGGATGGSTPLPPTADAGPDQVGRVGALVTLDGRASVARGGGALKYQWAPLGGASGVRLASAQSAQATFVPILAGSYEFQLDVVALAGGLSDSDRVVVVVVDDTGILGQRAPAAELRATGLAHAVFFAAPPALSGPASVRVLLADASILPISYVDVASDPGDDPPPAAVAGLLRIDAVVRGASFARLYAPTPTTTSDLDGAEVEFGDASRAPLRAFGIVGAAYVLDGSRSHDDGKIVNFHWTQTGGLLDIDTTGSGLLVVPIVPQTYEFTLVVTDDVGLVSFPRKAHVAVVPATALVTGPPLAKIAVAGGAVPRAVGSAQVLVSEVGTTITLDGRSSLSFASGSPSVAIGALQFDWRQVSGPTADAAGGASPLASFVPREAGGCEFELTVTDANGSTDVADVWVSVGQPGVIAPVAAVAPIADPVLPTGGSQDVSVTLDGTASQGVHPLSYSWTQVEGTPAFVVETSPGLGVVTLDQKGRYQFELRVFDGQAFSPPATVAFEVR